MKNDSRSAGLTIRPLAYQACKCSNTLYYSQGDFVRTPYMNVCETQPLPLIASFQLTPSLDQVLKLVPPASNLFHVYSVAKARQSVLNSVRMELAEIPDVKRMSQEPLDQLAKHIPVYSSPISPQTSTEYPPTSLIEPLFFSVLTITVSLLTFCVSFSLFCRQWRHLFSLP